MSRLLLSVSLCWVVLSSTTLADEIADFRSALQVTFPATVAVAPAGQANPMAGQQAAEGRQPNLFGPGMIGGIPIPAIPRFASQQTVRTGFAISANHVLTQLDGNTNAITITTIDRTKHDAKVVVRDHVTGLCVAKVDGVDLVSLVVGDGHPQPGLPVATTWIQDGVQRCKQGMISSPMNSSHPQIGMTQYIDFSNGPSVTGSPIIDTAGVLVGVTVQVANGSVVCLPAEQLNRLIDSALGDAPKDLERGLVGVAFLGDDSAVVAKVSGDSPAAKAGLQQGDEVIRIDDYPIGNSQDVVAAVAMARAGDTVEVTVKRDDETMTHDLVLKQHPQQRITLAPLPENQGGNRGIVQQQGWQLQDGKLVPMDLDNDGEFDMKLPRELQGLQELFNGDLNRVPNQFRVPRRFQGQRGQQKEADETIRQLEAERDQKEAKIKELNERIQELEKNN